MNYRTARNAEYPFGSEDNWTATEDQAGSDAEPGGSVDRRRLELGAAAEPQLCACEFHRQRADAEMEKALAAGPLSIAVRHLELAHLHRERMALLDPAQPRANGHAPCMIGKTDKEG